MPMPGSVESSSLSFIVCGAGGIAGHPGDVRHRVQHANNYVALPTFGAPATDDFPPSHAVS